MKERGMNLDKGFDPINPNLYLPDDFLRDEMAKHERQLKPLLPVPLAFFIGLAIGCLIMIPVWTIVLFVAFWFL